jgi:hypothetical protein
MGVTLARDPGPGKTDSGVVKTETNKSKPKKFKVVRLVPNVKRRHHRSVFGVDPGTERS